jgi:MoxR-like ATPase
LNESSRAKLAERAALLERVREEVKGTLVGLEAAMEEVLAALLAGGHVLLEGVPGTGKTLLVRTLALALELDFRRIQLTPDLLPADITGSHVLDEQHGRRTFILREGPVFGNVVLADEINRATPRTQSALLEAMAEGQVTVGGETRKLPDPFFLLATQNPIEMEGTYPLPEAELDRFFFKTQVPRPGPDELREILLRTTRSLRPAPRPILSAAQVLDLRAAVREIVTPPAILDYVVRLISALDPTTPDPWPDLQRTVRHGPGPRGAISLLLGSKALALLAGRPDVSFDDVARLVKPALRHRLLLTFEAEAEGLTSDRLLDDIQSKVGPVSPELQRWQDKLAPREESA